MVVAVASDVAVVVSPGYASDSAADVGGVDNIVVVVASFADAVAGESAFEEAYHLGQ